MKRFAKITAVLAAMVLALAFIGCSSGDDDDEPEEKFVTFKTAEGKDVLEVAGINEGNGSFKLTLDGASTPNEGTWKLKDESQTEIEISMGDAKISGTIEPGDALGEVKSISFKIEGKDYKFTPAN